jgi:RNA polymerase sigma-70 factor (ECF subfamily)
VDLKASQSPSPSSPAIARGGSAPASARGESLEGMEASDNDLAGRAACGARAAFECLLRRHYDRIHRLAWRFTGSVADAEDIAQEVCCKLVEKIGTFKGEAKFTTWLIGIAVNACRDHYRRGRAVTRLKTQASVFAGLASSPDGSNLHARVWLSSAIARLDPVLRDTILLVAGEDMSHAEAARALGVAESTVSWRMREARRLLSAEPEQETDHGH